MRSKHQDDTRCLARSGKGSRVHTPRTTRYRSSTLAGRNARIRVRTRFFCRRMISVRLCKGDLKYPSFAICGLPSRLVRSLPLEDLLPIHAASPCPKDGERQRSFAAGTIVKVNFLIADWKSTRLNSSHL